MYVGGGVHMWAGGGVCVWRVGIYGEWVVIEDGGMWEYLCEVVEGVFACVRMLCTHIWCHCFLNIHTCILQVLQDFSTAQSPGGGPDPVLKVPQQPGKQHCSLA